MELVQYGGSERNDIVRFDDVAMIVSAAARLTIMIQGKQRNAKAQQRTYT